MRESLGAIRMAFANEAEQFPQTSSVLPEMPKVANLRSVEAAPSAPSVDEERNPIFDALVTREGEISGLVAYSIYKQNKRAWLQDFIKASGRPPTDAESRAYIIGESTERRIATYRHLAAATLAGQGPEATDAYGKSTVRSGWFYVIGAIVLAAALGVLWLALHSGIGASLVTK
jgi:hypothetical protein